MRVPDVDMMHFPLPLSLPRGEGGSRVGVFFWVVLGAEAFRFAERRGIGLGPGRPRFAILNTQVEVELIAPVPP